MKWALDPTSNYQVILDLDRTIIVSKMEQSSTNKINGDQIIIIFLFFPTIYPKEKFQL
jgi:hypothetical protein